ncbi:Serine protease 56 [Gracilariopsis chorda]|uniref:Serine protease 56 n=1 Tax=Gracilariopsis chorda TaxID=448386 RepID=A0A2V3J246_9FLOR|nr:Serine protease 56 [Gracilariopsis chorda]|eukprot:PXF48464.1 Serine protease 56 [Gracilariopsis chorda]
MESRRYVEWQRRNFSGEPQYRAEYSRLNGASEGGTTVRLRATNIFEGGLFALAVRARTNGTQCFGDIRQQPATKVVFEAMPEQCPIRAREPNVSGVPRIVGGSVVNEGNSRSSFGWMALIWEMQGGEMRPICGGAQFENGYVATAAHCLVQLAPQNYRVSVGKQHAERQRNGVVRILEAYAHPRYETLASNEAVYDVAVLKLEGGGSDVVIELNVQSQVPRAGEFVTAAGYGYISEQWTALPVPNRLRRVDVPVVSSVRCERTFEGVSSEIHLCAGYEGGGCDSCQADSGGPLRSSQRSDALSETGVSA